MDPIRAIILVLSWPFAIVGAVWQFIAGSFYAGRMLMHIFIQKRAAKHAAEELERIIANAQKDAAPRPKAPQPGLH